MDADVRGDGRDLALEALPLNAVSPSHESDGEAVAEPDVYRELYPALMYGDISELRVQLEAHPTVDKTDLDGLIAVLEGRPPHTSRAIDEGTSRLLVDLYLGRASINDAVARSVGKAIASWVDNNPSAKALLDEVGFLHSLDEIPMTMETIPTVALILQHWVCNDPEAQAKVILSRTFSSMQALLAPLDVFGLKLHVPVAYRFACLVLELRPASHSLPIATDLWPVLCDHLLVGAMYFGRFHPIWRKCAQALIDIRERLPLLKLSKLYQGQAEVLSLVIKSSQERALLFKLLGYEVKSDGLWTCNRARPLFNIDDLL